MLRLLVALILVLGLLASFGGPLSAQDYSSSRAKTGGAQTLEEILARQNGLKGIDSSRPSTAGNLPEVFGSDGQLGTLGTSSDADIYRAFRDGSARMIASTGGAAGAVVMQDGGIRWLKFRGGPLPKYGGYLMLAMLAGIILFYALRGKIRIEGQKTGEMIIRFKALERLAHWMMAIPFILLAITGLTQLVGRFLLIPILGKEAFSLLAAGGKYVHNYIAWVFMAGLIMAFLLWVWDNFPNRGDLVWLAKGGGLFTKGVHPPSGKFNAGEKIIFWIVIVFGTLISLTGLALLFPNKIQMFAPLLQVMNDIGLSQMLGLEQINPALLAPQEEMQLAQLVHAGIAFVFITVIIAHIYLGTIGMEGALSSMTKGEVETQWAKEHHNIWYDEVVAKSKSAAAKTPAE